MAMYPDCESCAFYEVESAICDDCDDADQWEPAEPLDMKPITIVSRISSIAPITTKFHCMKKAA